MNFATDIESFWDVAYREGEHEKHWEYPHPSQELAALIAAQIIPPGATVLDVGCGAGRETIFLAQCGFQAIGVDLSREALKIARGRSEQACIAVEWRLGDVLDLPLEDASIDFAADRGCFHVLDRDVRERFARQIDRVLRPGGLFLLRGAARDCEEEGVLGFDAVELDRYFDDERFERGPVVPIVLDAPAGPLQGRLVLIHKNVR